MLKNGLYNVIGALIRMVLSLLTIPLLIRLIGVEEYGLWTLTSHGDRNCGLAEAGLSISTTVFVSRDLGANDTEGFLQTLTVTLGSMLVLAMLAAIGMWLSAPLVVSFFPYLPLVQQQIAVQAFQLGGVVVWARLLQQVLVGLEQAYQRYGMMNLLNTAQAALINFGIIIIAWRGGRTIAMMQWQVIVSILVLALHIRFGWTLLYQIKNIRPHWNHIRAKEVASYSGMTWMTSLGGTLFGQFDRVIVGALLGTAELGIYAAITNIAVQINALSALPVQPLMPNLAALYLSPGKNLQVVYPKIKRATEINSAVALGLGMVLFALAPLITQFVGIDISDDVNTTLLRTAIIIYTLYSLNAVGYFILFSTNAVKINLIIVLLSGIFSILLITIGAKFAGLSGAIWGNAGYILTLLLNFVGIRELNIKIRHWAMWLYFPVIWFIAVMAVNVNIATFGQQFVKSCLVLTLELTILFVWFMLSQGFNIKNLSQIKHKLT